MNIFEMQKQQTVVIFVDGLHRIAAALQVVSDVEFQLAVARIGGLENLVESLRALTHGTHVIVIAERDSQIGNSFAYLSEQFSQAPVLCRTDRPTLRRFIDELKIKSSSVMQELGVGSVHCQVTGLQLGIDVEISARQCSEDEVVLLEQVA